MKKKGFAKSANLLKDAQHSNSVSKLIALGEKYLPFELIIDFAWTESSTFEYPQEVIEKSKNRTEIDGGKFDIWLEITFAEYLVGEEILAITKKHKIPTQHLNTVYFALIKAFVICVPDVLEMDEVNPLTLKKYWAELRQNSKES